MASLTPPPGIDLAADKGPHIVSSAVALIVLPTVFVILRFVSRSLSGAGLWWDDLLVITSLLLSYGPNIAMTYSAKTNGFGKHLWALKDPAGNTGQFLKILYIYIIFYYTAVVSIKFCILSFYRRIFPVTEIRLWLYIGYGVLGSYLVGTLGSAIFQCQPIHGYWDKNINSHCISGDQILIVPGAINAVLDFFIIVLPIPLLWRLRTTNSQKGVLTGIFSCAGFVCVISVIRLVVLSRLEAVDVTWNFVDAAIWSAAEPAMGVIAACIPSLRPLLALVWRGSHRGPSMTSKSAQATTSSASSRMIWPGRSNKTDEAEDGRGFTRLEDPAPVEGGRWGHDTVVRGGRNKNSTTDVDDISLEQMNVPTRGIRVKNEIIVTSTNWDYKDRLF